MLRIVGRHDETKVMAVIRTPFRKRAVVGAVAFGIEHATRRAVLGDAVAAQVFEMGTEWRSLDCLPHDPRLNHRAARPISPSPGCCKARRPSAAEGAASCTVTISPVEPAGFLRSGQRLGNERLGALGAASVADPPQADA